MLTLIGFFDRLNPLSQLIIKKGGWKVACFPKDGAVKHWLLKDARPETCEIRALILTCLFGAHVPDELADYMKENTVVYTGLSSEPTSGTHYAREERVTVALEANLWNSIVAAAIKELNDAAGK